MPATKERATPPDAESTAPPKRRTKKAAKPARARSAFAYFASEYRGTLAEPPASLGELSRQCAAAWKEVEDKARFEALAAEDKTRAAEARAAAKQAAKQAAEGTYGGASSSDAPPPAPKVKRAPSAYVRFAGAERVRLKAAEPELSFGDLARRCGAAWKALTPEARAEFAS